MANPSSNPIFDRINSLAHGASTALIGEAQKLREEGVPAPVATSMVVDAALMAAASFLKTAVFNGVVRTTMPVEELLHLRLGELLAMQVRVFPRRPDGSFDPVGQSFN